MTEINSGIYVNKSIGNIKFDLLDKLGYHFIHKDLLLQPFVHPSNNKHGGGCYQRLEFPEDVVLDFFITSYLYSAYPKLKPGKLTNLRSLSVNNKAFACVAVDRSFDKFLLCDSSNLYWAVKNLIPVMKDGKITQCEKYADLLNNETDFMELMAWATPISQDVEPPVSGTILIAGYIALAVGSSFCILARTTLVAISGATTGDSAGLELNSDSSLLVDAQTEISGPRLDVFT
nr:endoribonuclease Dicer homolog 4-like [Arachis hypogaea]